MRFLVLGLLLLCIDWFAYQAISVPIMATEAPLQTLLSLSYWSIPLLTILYALSAQQGWLARVPKQVKVIATAMLCILYLFKLLTGTVILLDDVRRVVAWLISSAVPGLDLLTGRLPVMGTIGMALGGVPAILLIYGLVRNPYRYKVFTEDIDIPDLPVELDGLRIVQISDIHTGSLSDQKRVAKSVDLINALDPDIVFFTGDLVNNSADEADPYIPVFRQIRARFGIFSIVGNHDYGDYMRWPDAQTKQANFEKLIAQHARLGWDLLLNAHRTVQINGRRLGVIGVENYSAIPRFQKYGDMGAAIQNMEPHDLNILLTHDPSHWED